MILFFKFLLAHLLGDFVFQPYAWVKDKKKNGYKSPKLYFHLGVHALLLATVLFFDISFWLGFLLLLISHYGIDLIKIYWTNKKNERLLFFLDQILHLVSLALISQIYEPLRIDWQFLGSAEVGYLFLALVMVTFVGAILIKVIISPWNPKTEDKNGDSLAKAGRYIGMLERLFILGFVLLDFLGGIGFLLAAKSIFRFGDLRLARDRKLTEYILIGTLLSFGLAILIGILFKKLVLEQI
jgi:hypothetical protein